MDPGKLPKVTIDTKINDPDPPTLQTDRWTDGRRVISIARFALKCIARYCDCIGQ